MVGLLGRGVVSIAAVVLLGAGCGGGGSIRFGGGESACPPTTAGAPHVNTAEDLALAADCFFSAVAASTAVTWDLARNSVEGDPIYTRYAFNGDEITIVVDARKDRWGPQRVTAQTCESVARGAAGLPEGVSCRTTSHDGFVEAD